MSVPSTVYVLYDFSPIYSGFESPKRAFSPTYTLSPRIPKKMGVSLVTLEKVLSWRKCHFGAFKGRNDKEYMFSHAHDIK